MPWFIAKKKTEKRWRAYEVKENAALKRGYEMKGPFENYVQCFIAANKGKGGRDGNDEIYNLVNGLT